MPRRKARPLIPPNASQQDRHDRIAANLRGYMDDAVRRHRAERDRATTRTTRTTQSKG